MKYLRTSLLSFALVAIGGLSAQANAKINTGVARTRVGSMWKACWENCSGLIVMNDRLSRSRKRPVLTKLSQVPQ